MSTSHLEQKDANPRVVAEIRSKLSLPSYTKRKNSPNSSFCI